MTASRTIRRLQLRSRSESDARHMVPRFEDALRTASLPEAGSRLIFVRRLNLGRISGDSSPTLLSRLLADAFTHAGVTPVHGASGAAGDAFAVWFRDVLEAHVLLTTRVLRGVASPQWFWRLAVSGFEVTLDAPTALRTIALNLLQQPEAATALPQWCAAVVRDGQGGALVSTLDHSTVSILREHTARWRPASLAGRSSSSTRSRSVNGSLAQAELLALLIDWLDMAGEPALATRLLRDVAGSAQRAAAPTPLATINTSATQTAPPARSDHNEQEGSKAIEHPVPSTPMSVTRAERRRAQAAPESHPSESTVAVGDANQDIPFTLEGQPTSAGGLGFLLSVLAWLGYPQWLQRHPEWAARSLTTCVFAQVLHRLSIADDDPVWALAQVSGVATEPPAHFIAPDGWRDGLLARGQWVHECAGSGSGSLTDASRRLLLAMWLGQPPELLAEALRDARRESIPPFDAEILESRVVDAWCTAIRRWLRRHARIGLVDLVRRPGRVALTPTHLDIWFEPTQADLRVRRIGLDIDPGWLPWYGRVVGFHYERWSDA